jgi:phosphoribosylformylglycinamidine synthase
MASSIGATLIGGAVGVPDHAFWYGEDQARYLVACPIGAASALVAQARAAEVPALVLGTTGGDALMLPDGQSILVSALRQRHEGFLPSLMAPNRVAA